MENFKFAGPFCNFWLWVPSIVSSHIATITIYRLTCLIIDCIPDSTTFKSLEPSYSAFKKNYHWIWILNCSLSYSESMIRVKSQGSPVCVRWQLAVWQHLANRQSSDSFVWAERSASMEDTDQCQSRSGSAARKAFTLAWDLQLQFKTCDSQYQWQSWWDWFCFVWLENELQV